MNPAVPQHQGKGNSSSAWIFRLTLGALLIGVSVWGISLCHEIFRVSVEPDALPGDASYANLGAWASWTLFFGPIAVAGVLVVRSTLRKLGALDQFAFWLWERAGRPNALLVKTKQYGGIAPGSAGSDPHGLEDLPAETVERLQRVGTRAATILGGLLGTSSLGIGIFGLLFLLLFARPYGGSSFYVTFATGRIETIFALLFGILVFLGFAVLRRTFRRDNNNWLLPLRVFTYMIVRRRQASEPTKRVGQHLTDPKQPPSM